MRLDKISEREGGGGRQPNAGSATLLCDRLWTNARLATMAAGVLGTLRRRSKTASSPRRDGRILYAGRTQRGACLPGGARRSTAPDAGSRPG